MSILYLDGSPDQGQSISTFEGQRAPTRRENIMIIETSDDRWPDDIIRLLRDQRQPAPEPTATEAAAYVGMQIAEYGAYAIIVICIAGFWIGTPS
jgi:hypothetical protein